ncbi:putative transcription factor ZF-HD family [Helianthus annuus]|nr:putative transcription factor ZF-HD family [Helianthus annuus]
MALKHPTPHIPYHESEPTPPHSPSIKHHHHHPPPHTAATYKECLKNHAARIGGHALDGCGEFMPQTHTPTDPSSYKCAACGCHRNFHRREPTTTTATRTHFIDFHRPHQTSTSTSTSPPISPSPQPTNYAYGEHLLLSLRTAPDQNHTPGTPVAIKISGRKRFRTKFSQDQKDKMLSFAEKVGWKMQRCDDKMVVDFCNEIGIRRSVFKVWIHNNKNTLAKREKDSPATGTATGNTVVAAALVCSDDTTHQDHGSSSSS